MPSGIIAAWREVRMIVLGLAALCGLGIILHQQALAIGAGVLLLGVFYFFRDPDRPLADYADRILLAPADGRVQTIEVVEEQRLLHGPANRVRIFISLFDVHVQRAAHAGEVCYIEYRAGGFAPAFLPRAERNETNFVGLMTAHGPVLIAQITGLLGRRVVCWVKVGDRLAQGQRFGLIKFGSRVDLYLPLQCEVLVKPGQTVFGGQTTVARWSSLDAR